VLLVIACAGLGAVMAGRLGHTVAYVEVVRFVPAGTRLSAADLGASDLSGSGGLSAVPVSALSEMLGRRAAVSLEPGSLLVAGDLASGSASPVPRGEALVGAALDPQQLPSTLEVGDRVLVVLGGAAGTGSTVGGAGGGAGAPTRGGSVGLAGGLAVGDVEALYPIGSNGPAGASGASDLVTLEVPASQAAAVTQASAAGDVSLAEIAGGAGS
jgi:hypothetical protein